MSERADAGDTTDEIVIDLDMMRARKRVADVIKRKLAEHGVTDESRMSRWLADRCDVRWQTTQQWVLGNSFPQGKNLMKLAAALNMTEAELLGPLRDALEPKNASWVAFLETPEGKSMDDEERWLLRLFSWPKEPQIGDYRGLLALIRTNAER